MFDGIPPSGPPASGPPLDPRERRAARRSLVIGSCALLAAIAASALLVATSPEVPQQLAFMGP